MYSESARFKKLHIQDDQEISNPKLAPFIVEGGSIFKKTAHFSNSILIGPNKGEKEGMIAYRDGEFMGYNGTDWRSFTQDGYWKEGDGVLFIDGKKIGINKINPKKMLEVGGDVLIDKKLNVKDDVLLEIGLQLGENIGRKKRGMIRFYEGNFEGFDGENWIKFGGELKIEEKKEEINLETVDKIRLMNCPLRFYSAGNETNLYYDWVNSEFRLEKLHKNFTHLKYEDLSIGSLKVHGDIIFNDGGRKTIRNVSDPIIGSDVATKKYVDQMCSGLQNYILVDFMYIGESLEGDELELLEDFKVGDNIFIYVGVRNELVEVLEIGEKIKFRNISNVNLPAKVCVKGGRYGPSEYLIFGRNSYMQIGGSESLEFCGQLEKVGREVHLRLDENIFVGGSIRERAIGENMLGDGCILGRHLGEGIINSVNLLDNIVEARHIGSKVIGGMHLQLKSIGDMHLKDGFLKNIHFTPGIVTDRELANECIGVSNLRSSVIYQKHLTRGCVLGDNVVDGELEGKHLCDKFLDTRHFREKIIFGEHLSSSIIGSEHLLDKSIGDNHIKDLSISSEHLRLEIIGKEHLKVNIVGGLHIQENSIMGSHIREQAITFKHLSQKCIMDWHLGDNIVGVNNLLDGCVDGRKLGERILEERHFVEGSIGGSILKKNSITSGHIGVNMIDDKHLSNYCIKNSKLVDGCITESKMVDGCVTASKIRDGSVTVDKLRLPFIKVQADPVFTCTQMVNLGETLMIGLNQNYMVPKRRDGVVEFLSSVRFGEEGTGQRMVVNMDVDVSSEVNVSGRLRLGGVDVVMVGEVRGFCVGLRFGEKFMDCWARCDGKRVGRSEYPELARMMGVEDDFYLPDIRGDGLEYYVRVR